MCFKNKNLCIVPTQLIYVLCVLNKYILTDWPVFHYVAEVFVNDFQMVLVASTITHITFVSTSLYFHCKVFKY